MGAGEVWLERDDHDEEGFADNIALMAARSVIPYESH